MGGSARASSGGLRLVLLALFAAGLLLIPAAQASAEDFSLTIEEIGSGSGFVECEVEGVEEPCASEYEEGTEVTVFAYENPGSEFIDFSGDCGPIECFLEMDTDHIVVVEFELIEFSLTIETDGTGSGKVECELQEGVEPCLPVYPEGDEVKLVPLPDPGSEFVEFSGECDPTECELTMEEDHLVTVTFNLVGPALSIAKLGTGSGTVKCKAGEGPLEACAPAYTEGTELLLVASANPGSQFVGWSGDCTADPCELPVEEKSLTVTATFNLEPTTPGGGGGGSGGGTGTKPPTPLPGKLGVSGAALFQGGKAVLRLSCKGQGPCKGSLKLVAKLKVGKAKAKNIEIGKASFNLAAGVSKTLKVKLAGAAKKVLGKAKNVKATVSGTGVTKSTVTIKPTAR
ncbi:MAG TPA: hypothetical protein VIS51_12325 [Solirubrobacterales bacterium]